RELARRLATVTRSITYFSFVHSGRPRGPDSSTRPVARPAGRRARGRSDRSDIDREYDLLVRPDLLGGDEDVILPAGRGPSRRASVSLRVLRGLGRRRLLVLRGRGTCEHERCERRETRSDVPLSRHRRSFTSRIDVTTQYRHPI